MAKLYADEMFPLPVTEALRRLGYDVLTMQEDGKDNQRYPDESILKDATVYGRAVLTVNRKHFRRLHRQSLDHSGIISCTYDPDFEAQAGRIHQEIGEHKSLEGKLVLIYRPS